MDIISTGEWFSALVFAKHYNVRSTQDEYFCWGYLQGVERSYFSCNIWNVSSYYAYTLDAGKLYLKGFAT